MAQSPSGEHPAGIVVKQWQKGFMLGDRLIRPCRVVVSSGPGPASEDTPVDPTEE
jgi:molecular chaperone GrpE